MSSISPLFEASPRHDGSADGARFSAPPGNPDGVPHRPSEAPLDLFLEQGCGRTVHGTGTTAVAQYEVVEEEIADHTATSFGVLPLLSSGGAVTEGTGRADVRDVSRYVAPLGDHTARLGSAAPLATPIALRYRRQNSRPRSRLLDAAANYPSGSPSMPILGSASIPADGHVDGRVSYFGSNQRSDGRSEGTPHPFDPSSRQWLDGGGLSWRTLRRLNRRRGYPQGSSLLGRHSPGRPPGSRVRQPEHSSRGRSDFRGGGDFLPAGAQDSDSLDWYFDDPADPPAQHVSPASLGAARRQRTPPAGRRRSDASGRNGSDFGDGYESGFQSASLWHSLLRSALNFYLRLLRLFFRLLNPVGFFRFAASSMNVIGSVSFTTVTGVRFLILWLFPAFIIWSLSVLFCTFFFGCLYGVAYYMIIPDRIRSFPVHFDYHPHPPALIGSFASWPAVETAKDRDPHSMASQERREAPARPPSRHFALSAEAPSLPVHFPSLAAQLTDSFEAQHAWDTHREAVPTPFLNGQTQTPTESPNSLRVPQMDASDRGPLAEDPPPRQTDNTARHPSSATPRFSLSSTNPSRALTPTDHHSHILHRASAQSQGLSLQQRANRLGEGMPAGSHQPDHPPHYGRLPLDDDSEWHEDDERFSGSRRYDDRDDFREAGSDRERRSRNGRFDDGDFCRSSDGRCGNRPRDFRRSRESGWESNQFDSSQQQNTNPPYSHRAESAVAFVTFDDRPWVAFPGGYSFEERCLMKLSRQREALPLQQSAHQQTTTMDLNRLVVGYDLDVFLEFRHVPYVKGKARSNDFPTAPLKFGNGAGTTIFIGSHSGREMRDGYWKDDERRVWDRAGGYWDYEGEQRGHSVGDSPFVASPSLSGVNTAPSAASSVILMFTLDLFDKDCVRVARSARSHLIFPRSAFQDRVRSLLAYFPKMFGYQESFMEGRVDLVEGISYREDSELKLARIVMTPVVPISHAELVFETRLQGLRHIMRRYPWVSMLVFVSATTAVTAPAITGLCFFFYARAIKAFVARHARRRKEERDDMEEQERLVSEPEGFLSRRAGGADTIGTGTPTGRRQRKGSQRSGERRPWDVLGQPVTRGASKGGLRQRWESGADSRASQKRVRRHPSDAATPDGEGKPPER